MTCGHCASTITQALKAVDKGAQVTIDLARHLVLVDPAEADANELQDAIAAAGYSPTPADTVAVGPSMPAKPCCGQRRGQ
jgi:copper chaperone